MNPQSAPPPPPKSFPWFRTCLVLGGLTAGVIAFSRHHPELPWCRQVDEITRPAVDKTCEVGARTWDWAQTQWTEVASRKSGTQPGVEQDPFGGRRDPAIPPMTVYFTPTEPGSRYAVNRVLCSMIRSANRSVLASYTDLDDDELAQALIAAHRTKGVMVRVGVDNRNCMRPAVQTLIRAGVAVLTDRSSAAVDCNFLVIDEQVVSFGSLKPTFKDLYRNNNCLITVADRKLAQRFAAFFPVVYPASGAAGSAVTTETQPARSVTAAGPDGAIWGLFADDHVLQERLVGQMGRAEKSIDLIGPVLTNDAVIEALLKAGRRGVAVRVCLDRSALLSAETRLLLENSGVRLIRPTVAGQVRETAVVIDSQITACLSGGLAMLDSRPRRALALLVNSSGLAGIFTAEFEQIAGNKPAPVDGFAYELSQSHQITPLLSLPAR